MTKPIDETWTIDDDGVVAGDFSATDEDGFCIVSAYSQHEGDAGDAHALARLRLATAAPTMARHLLSILRGYHQGYRLTPAEVAAIESDLHKAGVL